jgi:dihydroorotate dehydrogenase (fumarate)
MVDISTDYMGLKLRSPLVASSCGLTAHLNDLKKFEDSGVGAIILKSIFEEEIIQYAQESITRMSVSGSIYPEALDYFEFEYEQLKDPLSDYLNLIGSAKKELAIPVIASISCLNADGWLDYAQKIEQAGADALELNLFILPSDFTRTSQESEAIYFSIVSNVLEQVSIPVSLKIGYYSAALGLLIQQLSETGVKGITLFNRMYAVDFSTDTMEFTPPNVLSNPADISTSLRWIAIMYNRVRCDLAASTGVLNGNAMVKQILAGAKVVAAASAFYRHGIPYAQEMLKDLKKWMEANSYPSLDAFRGKMSKDRTYNPAAFERVQFMKYFRD